MMYLAQPYYHEDVVIMHDRAMRGMEMCAGLMLQGYHVFSPIAHCHHIATFFKLPKDHSFWLRYDDHILERCTQIAVIPLYGWHNSVGLKHELRQAELLGLETFEARWQGQNTTKKEVYLTKIAPSKLLAQM